MDKLQASVRHSHNSLAAVGTWLRQHQRTIAFVQWVIVALYVTLLSAPTLLPMPEREAHIWNHLTLFAQFAFWGVWWPFVLLSMIIVGRSWCGLFCPEGTLAEAASKHGLGRAVPRWIRWKGWPFTAFALTTVYGQLVSVYQYPWPAVVILGGSTVAAMTVGFAFGREKRVWCRYLCPVNGVFGLLAKLAPVHYRVDQAKWRSWTKPLTGRPPRFNCAPLVPLPTMKGGQNCHMCGRCDGVRDAVALSLRSPSAEVIEGTGNGWETALIVFGMIGLASGAFHWSNSAWLVQAKIYLAEHLVAAGILWPLEPKAPWYLLTNYPEQNDAMSLLDGALVLSYMLAMALVTGSTILFALSAATRLLGPWDSRRLHHLAQALIPIAGCGLFLGLSGLTVTMLRNDGVWIGFVPALRAAFIVAAAGWSMYFGIRLSMIYAPTLLSRIAANACIAAAVAIASLSWSALYWHVL
jgi:polyferredoxin